MQSLSWRSERYVSVRNVTLAIAQPPFKISKISQTASKQPRRSKLMLQVKLVTPIYYVTKFQGIFISQKMTLLPDKHDP